MTANAETNLPYTYSIRGVEWFFRYGSIDASLGTDYGSERFLQQYYELCSRIVGHPSGRGLVYFLGWDGGPIKIGLADNARIRLNTLQVACPYKLRLLATVEGGVTRERAYHMRFAAFRIRGEWFERCPKIEIEIARLNRKPHHAHNL